MLRSLSLPTPSPQTCSCTRQTPLERLVARFLPVSTVLTAPFLFFVFLRTNLGAGSAAVSARRRTHAPEPGVQVVGQLFLGVGAATPHVAQLLVRLEHHEQLAPVRLAQVRQDRLFVRQVAHAVLVRHEAL